MGIYLGSKLAAIAILGGAAVVGYMILSKKGKEPGAKDFTNYDPRYPDRYVSPVVFMRNHAPAVKQERLQRHVYNDYDWIGPYKTDEVPTWWTVSGIHTGMLPSREGLGAFGNSYQPSIWSPK